MASDRTMSRDEALAALRLISELASRFAREEKPSTADYAAQSSEERSAFHFEQPTGLEEHLAGDAKPAQRARRIALPDPRLVRRIIRQRQLRARFFEGELFADPAWDILLDLTAARAEHIRVSVTSLCIASGVPPTTALRWISELTQAGLLARSEDETDRRRAFITLSDKAVGAMARYFSELGKSASHLI